MASQASGIKKVSKGQKEHSHDINSSVRERLHTGVVIQAAVDRVNSDGINAQLFEERQIPRAVRTTAERIDITRWFREISIRGIALTAGGELTFRLVGDTFDVESGARGVVKVFTGTSYFGDGLHAGGDQE